MLSENKRIIIQKSASADTRSAKELISKETLSISSFQHIKDVEKAIEWMIDRLKTIALSHDWTKIHNIDEFHTDFKMIQEGHLEDFKNMNWFQNYHLKERHHLNDRCPDDVNLFDVLELIADCVIAGMARTGNVFPIKLSSEMLEKAVQNTVKLIKDNTEVIETI